jgi:hypothetical protein
MEKGIELHRMELEGMDGMIEDVQSMDWGIGVDDLGSLLRPVCRGVWVVWTLLYLLRIGRDGAVTISTHRSDMYSDLNSMQVGPLVEMSKKNISG